MNRVTCADVFAKTHYTFIDVRSPSEFARGHIGGAHNVSLFSDQLCALVGVKYAQYGKQAALELAIEQVGPHIADLIASARRVYTGKTLCIYCARGGMRSAGVAQLYTFVGLPVCVLTGGYKAFRNWVLQQFTHSRQVHVLSGKTGAGKTEALAHLASHGHQVIDLEALAQHRGSVFGGNLDEQTTQQQFENDLACAWQQASADAPLWLEDESRKIGSVIIPEPVWLHMQAAPIYFLDTPDEERIQRIMKNYGHLDEDFIKKALTTIAQQLGRQMYAHALQLLAQNDRISGVKLLLAYYDKKYAHGLSKKQNVTHINSLSELIEHAKTNMGHKMV